jgi:hypothetical protein
MDCCGLLNETDWTFVYINRGNITHSVSCGTRGGPCLLCQYPWRMPATVHKGYTVLWNKEYRNSNFIKSIQIGQRAKINFNSWRVPMLGGIPVPTAWRVLGLRMEERPPDMEVSCEYIE